MKRFFSIATISSVACALVAACQGSTPTATETSASTQGAGGSTSTSTATQSPSSAPGSGGCSTACITGCGDDPQFPIQKGDQCVQCITDDDCKNLQFESAYGLKCQPDGRCGCAIDKDCVGDSVYPRCRAAEATCVSCLSNADCETTCQPDGNCAPCSADADCSAAARGPHCSGNPAAPPAGSSGCRCQSDAECSTSPAGPRCAPVGDTSGTLACGCSDAADCTGSAFGHACTTAIAGGDQRCGCAADADCDPASSCQPVARRCFPK